MPTDNTTPETRAHGTILLVEDDEFLRDLLAQKLEAKGYEVRIAADGETALHSVASKLPDLMLVDVYLPGMSGFELIAKLRQQEASAHIPFMILSNSAESQSKHEGETLGAERYLVKAESTPLEILEAVEAWFAKR